MTRPAVAFLCLAFLIAPLAGEAQQKYSPNRRYFCEQSGFHTAER
jgi:hypothetical protein